MDLWLILSEYIDPEDVGTFAGICKDAYYAVSTPKFWLRMQKL